MAESDDIPSPPHAPGQGQRSGPSDLHINILGANFSITAGESPEYLNEVMDQYRLAVANTQGISGMKDPLKVAILTGFLLCDEINKLKVQMEEEQVAVEKIFGRTRNLVLRLDKAVDMSISMGTHPGDV